MFRYTLLISFGLYSFTAFSQEEQDPNEEAKGQLGEIEVIRDYKPILADAVKIRQSPDLTNERKYLSKLNYNIFDKKLDINTGTHRLEIQEVPTARPDVLTNNYAKIGVGNFNTLLGEVYISNGEDEALQVGGFIKHLSQKGTELTGQNFSEQKVGLFGRSILDQITLNGEIGFNRYATRYYGFVPLQPDLNNDPTKQHYNDLYIKGELNSNYEENDELLSYSLRADGYLFGNAFSARENSFALSGNLNKKINAFNLGANVSGDFTNVQSQNQSLANHIARLNPYIRFQGNNYKITLGATLVSEFGGDESRNNIFPTVDLDFALVPEYASLYAGVKGDVVKTSFRTLANENPFLMERPFIDSLNNTNTLVIHNMLEKIHAFGGIKGNAGATLGYKIGIFYKQLSDLPLYTISPNNPSRYDIIYDRGEKNTVFGFEGDVNVRVSEAFTLGGNLIFNEYDLENEAEAWFIPKLRVAANTRINIGKKVYIDGELFFNDAMKARSYNKYVGIGGDPDAPVTVSLPAFADISAGIEYRATKQIGVYVRGNNLLSNSYQRFLYYPRLGFNVIGGLNVSF
ncbi:TonB-dependent receptor [Olivibacter sp. SDN3]|uniref:TonB-dependent receptor n=1 Tax=Olivibacter sp. SDN3 TaxID=2764720 RepID=UPI0016518B57|nr:TonB-dependent receptor [Olivibacter sp. SDN3]QNL52138.1 TonB-dependent receptor [Olivibacter sp. SDN3]